MELNSQRTSINCCFCDKNLSPCDKEEAITIKINRYKCPGCERIYCSANCCCGHKDKFDCSGIRNSTPYIPLNKFDQKQFLDDYFFLEKINNEIDRAQRTLPRIKISCNPTKNNQISQKKIKKRYNNRRKKSATSEVHVSQVNDSIETKTSPKQ